MTAYEQRLQIQRWLAAYQPPPKQPIQCHGDCGPDTRDMELLRGYFGLGWALCKFHDGEGAEQLAFNAACAGVPEAIRCASPGRGGPEWIVLMPGCTDKSDPLGQAGYIGAKWRVT